MQHSGTVEAPRGLKLFAFDCSKDSLASLEAMLNASGRCRGVEGYKKERFTSISVKQSCDFKGLTSPARAREKVNTFAESFLIGITSRC